MVFVADFRQNALGQEEVYSRVWRDTDVLQDQSAQTALSSSTSTSLLFGCARMFLHDRRQKVSLLAT